MPRLMYFSPPSGRMATILFDGSFSAARMAAKTLAPEDIPARMPSCRASSTAVLMESSLETVSIPPMTVLSRFSGTKFAPMPCILCGPACPLVTSGLSAGSMAMTFASDPASLKASAMPVAVPPVPKPA